MSDVDVPLSFVRLFTDGACKGNPGPGGWGCILRHPASESEKEFSGGELDTTNNQMELQAVIEGLSRLSRRSRVEVVTDSKYVADGCRSWIAGWKHHGWKRKSGNKFLPVRNVERWKTLDALIQKHEVQFTVVRGHTGHPENERCDELAVAAAEKARRVL
ncbi:MAG: ribonuclease HI [Fuerstiella sp.]|nr:ribonuclease HI [Fuerstiella sp.]